MQVHPLVALNVTTLRLHQSLEKNDDSSVAHIAIDVSRDSSYMVIADPEEGKISHLDLNTRNYTKLFQDGNCDYLIPGHMGPSQRTWQPWFAERICSDVPVPSSHARFLHPTSVRIAPSGAFWLVADSKAHRIRRVHVATGYVDTVAGTGQASVILYINPDVSGKRFLAGGLSGDGGLAVHAHLNEPWDVAILEDDEEIFLIADRKNHRVRLVTRGIITTVAGIGLHHALNGSRDCIPASQAELTEPAGVDWLPGGRRAFIVADTQWIRLVDENNYIQTLLQARHQSLMLARVLPIGSELYASFILKCNEARPKLCSDTMSNCYAGCQTQTVGGSTCQPWGREMVALFPRENLNNNFCRFLPTPDGQGGFTGGRDIWCYIRGHNRNWEICKPKGEDRKSSRLVFDRRGSSINKVLIPNKTTFCRQHSAPGHFLLRVDPPRWEDRPENASAKEVLTHAAAVTVVGTSAFAIDKNGGEVFHMTWQPYSCSATMPEYHPGAGPDSPCCACEAGLYADREKQNCQTCDAGFYCDGKQKKECGAFQTTSHVARGYRCDNSTCHREASSDHICSGNTDGPDRYEHVDGVTCKCHNDEHSVLPGTICLRSPDSSSQDCCTCDHDTYSESSTCRPCPTGVACPASWQRETHRLRIRNGYWAQNTGSNRYNIYRCHQEAHCWWSGYAQLWNASYWRNCQEAEGSAWYSCSLGKPFDFSLGGKPDVCHGLQREGFRCGRCKPDYIEQGTKCTSCGKANKATPVLTLLINLALMLRFHAFFNNPKQSSATASYMMTNAASSLVNFLQEYSLLALINIDWPHVFVLDDLLRLLPQFTFTIVPIECWLGNSFAVRFIWSLLRPVQVFVMMCMLWAALTSTAFLRKRLPEKLPEALERRVHKTAAKYLKGWLKDVRTFKMEKNKVMNTLGFFICALYVALIRLPMSLIQTKPAWVSAMPQQDGTFSQEDPLEKYPDVTFLSDEWWPMLYPGIAGFLCWSIGVFALHAYVTWHAPQSFTTDAVFRARRKYFFAKYREDRYWFGLISMFFALLLNLAIYVLSQIGDRKLRTFQVQIVFCIVMCNVGFLTFTSPYKNVLNTKLDCALKIVMIWILTVSSTETSMLGSVEHLFSFVLVGGLIAVACLAVLLSLMYASFLPYRWEKHYDDYSIALGYLTQSLFSRLDELRGKTLLAVIKTLSPTEREHMMSSLLFLEKGLNLRPPKDTQEDLIPTPEASLNGSGSISAFMRRSFGSSTGQGNPQFNISAAVQEGGRRSSLLRLGDYLRDGNFSLSLTSGDFRRSARSSISSSN